MKKLSSLLFSFLVLASCSQVFASEIPEPYRSIKDLPFDGHGWFVNDKQLEHFLTEKNPKIVIEIGSWLGCSTRFIASHISDDAILYAVDTWKGSTNEVLHMQDPRLPYLYQLFLSNVKHAQLTHKIIPLRMDSVEASKMLNVKAELIYLDGDHATDNVIKDIMHWYPHLTPNGMMCGDDWNWGSVQNAVVYCASVLNKEVNHIDNFWWFE